MQSVIRSVAILTVFLCSGCANPIAQPTTRPTSSFQRVDLLAIADWGTNSDIQRRVANGMCNLVTRERANGANFAGVICGGDNVYLQNLTGVDDPRLRQMFSEMYDPAILDFPFYVAPGNHDYDEGKIAIELAFAAVEPTKRWTMPSNYYRVDLPRGSSSPSVMLLALDSERDKLGPDKWSEENKWILDQMRSPRDPKTWRIALAHHPLFSNGDHGDVGPLQIAWGEPFKVGELDLLVAGHDHDIQHLEITNWPFSFILVGGGGAKTRPMRADARGPFSKQMNGFGHISFTAEKMTVSLCDADGNVVHQFVRDRAGKVTITTAGASDRATPRTVKSINRPDLPSTGPTTKSED